MRPHRGGCGSESAGGGPFSAESSTRGEDAMLLSEVGRTGKKYTNCLQHMSEKDVLQEKQYQVLRIAVFCFCLSSSGERVKN